MPPSSQDLIDAMQHWQARRIPDADAAARRALLTSPDQVEALVIVALASLSRDDPATARDFLLRATSLAPDVAVYQLNLAEACRRLKFTDDAIASYRRVIALDPNLAEAHNNMGALLDDQGKHDEAAECFRRAVALRADYGLAWANLASALMRAENAAEALPAAHRAVQLLPQRGLSHLHLGMAMKDLGRVANAIAPLRAAIQLSPELATAHFHLGDALMRLGDFDAAIASFQTARHLSPNFRRAYYSLGVAFTAIGRLDDAIATFRAGTLVAPDDPELASNLLFALIYQENADPDALLLEHLAWAERFESPLAVAIRAHEINRDPNRRLRIGYLSPYFRAHCQSFFTLPLLANHDHERCEIVCYSDALKTDRFTDRLRTHADVWRDVSAMEHQELAELIRADRIDILIDLTMHMARNRLLVFARKPAPIQICWLAYPGTTGLRAIDYRFTDPFLDPPDSDDRKYSEQTIRLPETFWCYDPISEEPVRDLPAQTNGFITFGCLNNFYKINDRVLHTWAKVLSAVPNSRLILLAPIGHARTHLLEIFSREHVEASRIEFVLFRPRDEYLRTYHRIDIALDTFPVNGHTTSLDALWMGVPVVTLIGSSAVGRAGLSQLTNLDLTELATMTPENFLTTARGLAHDLERLTTLRRTLRQRMQSSPLMDGKRFAIAIEAAYREVWSRNSIE